MNYARRLDREVPPASTEPVCQGYKRVSRRTIGLLWGFILFLSLPEMECFSECFGVGCILHISGPWLSPDSEVLAKTRNEF